MYSKRKMRNKSHIIIRSRDKLQKMRTSRDKYQKIRRSRDKLQEGDKVRQIKGEVI